MKHLSLAVALALAVSLILLPDAAWAWGPHAIVPAPSIPANVVVVRPNLVVVTPRVVQPRFVDRPVIDPHRVLLPKPPSLEPLPQPVWVPGSWQWVNAQFIWVPSHFEGPGQLLILPNPTTQP